jgi:hypothetical protein
MAIQHRQPSSMEFFAERKKWKKLLLQNLYFTKTKVAICFGIVEN